MSVSQYRKKYVIRPMSSLLDLYHASANASDKGAAWPSMNIQLNRKSVCKRPGYTIDRTLVTGDPVYDCMIYTKQTGINFSLILTEQNLIKRETATGKTWSYLTPTYATGTAIASGTGVEGTTVDWVTAAIAAGDKYVNTADLTSDEEPDSAWRTISSVTDLNTLVLTAAYTGTGTGAYKIRKVYSVPENERWAWAVVGDKFCFTNGNVPVQYWDGSAATAADLDATNALKARYCMNYADRLIIADYYSGSNRQPFSIKWSKNGDPTDWTDSTAGENDFIDTDDFITGLGRVGQNIVVYKENSIIFGNMTGKSTDPLEFPNVKRGIGCASPYSIVEVQGTNAFLAKDNFYVINGDVPESIGDPIRDKFFDVVPEGERKKVFGRFIPSLNKILWIAGTNDGNGKLGFLYDVPNREWVTWKFYHEVTALGFGGQSGD